ncbi:MAG: putative Zn-binding protein involved in type VI secretion [Arenicella sp.]|jgi:uncharacterized Zn-binding protein involved in type VI secretion
MPRNFAHGLLKATTMLMLGLFSAAVLAQSTTSSIRGKLLDTAGNPVANAEVVVTDQRTGSQRRVSSNNRGTFFASNLQVGGPFVVSVDNVDSAVVNNISLGDAYQLTIENVGAVVADGSLEEVIVTGKAVAADISSGPSAVFSLDVLESAVAFNRDIKDVFSNDPRINLDDPSRGSAVNCGGKNPRFNSLSIDGVGQNDRFGLNSNGFASSNGQPFPFDALEQISVELAPFDVTAGGFSACAINAVTKSGRNEFFGSAVYEYSSDSLRGDNFEFRGEKIDVGNSDFTEETTAFTLGGPIIEDKLFFFLAYEESEQPIFNATGFNGSGNGTERGFLSETDFNRIVDIANRVYGYDPGGQPQQSTNDRDALIGRLDWDINDDHRATLIYNKFEGGAIVSSDNDTNEFEFANHFYNRGSDLETSILRLSSQWTDSLSTELFLSRQENTAIQQTVGDREFGDFQISINRDTVYLGADDSRQSNGLNYESNLIKFNLQYLTGNHVITAGFERDELDIFNLFVQHSRGGELDFFDDSGFGGLSGIDKFELGLPNRIFYGSGGVTNDPNDAAANYTITQETLLLQDEYYFEDLGLTVVGGLRYERFSSNDRPAFNAAFTAENGIRNDANIDGVDIFQPRIGFTWDANDFTRVRGGVGIFSGGNPNVWISNSYSNDGITNVQQRQSFDQSLFDLPLSGAGRPGFDVPQALVDAVAATTPQDAATTRLSLIDPNYEQPSEIKLALGATIDLKGEYTLDADLLYSQQRDSAIYVDLSQREVGRTVAGSPVLRSVVGNGNFMLTNSDEDADTLVLSLGLSKKFENGLSMNLGYAYSDAEDISGMNSSVAFSNFSNVATNDANNLKPGTSEYNTPHRLTFRLGYENNFVGDLMTRLSVYGVYKNGQATSLTMSNSGLEDNSRGSRQLLYIPGANDGAVVYADGFDRQGFDELISSRSLARGQFVSRNDENARSSARVDLRIDQDLPMIGGVKPKVFLKINNVLNLLNSDWGAQYDAPFVSEQVVESSLNDSGQFVYENFRGATTTETIDSFSIWQARIGIEFKF